MHSLPPELLVSIFKHCNASDIRRLLKTCHRFRNIISQNRNRVAHIRVSHYNLLIEFGQDIIIADVTLESNPFDELWFCRKNVVYNFQDSEIENASVAVCISPGSRLFLIITVLDDRVMRILKLFSYDLDQSTLVLIIGKVQIPVKDFRNLLEHLRPDNLTFEGAFDRSILTNNFFHGCGFLRSLHIFENPLKDETRSRATTKILGTVADNFEREKKIVNIFSTIANAVVADLQDFIERFLNNTPANSTATLYIDVVSSQVLYDMWHIGQRFLGSDGITGTITDLSEHKRHVQFQLNKDSRKLVFTLKRNGKTVYSHYEFEEPARKSVLGEWIGSLLWTSTTNP